jgi:hypothetical protein
MKGRERERDLEGGGGAATMARLVAVRQEPRGGRFGA